jgi:hypothetical protein
MTKLILAEENLDFIKRELRTHFPNVKSSHLSEAIAAGLGSRTNIALIARMRAAQGMPDLVQVSDESFAVRLAELDDGSVTVGLRRAARSPSLPVPIWMEIDANDIPSQNSWFARCQRRNIPYVYVSRRRKYARVDWDFIATNGKHDVSLDEGGRGELVHQMFDRFKCLVKTKRAMFEGSAFVGQVDNLMPDEAYDLADEMFGMLYGVMRH